MLSAVHSVDINHVTSLGILILNRLKHELNVQSCETLRMFRSTSVDRQSENFKGLNRHSRYLEHRVQEPQLWNLGA